ncbi:MAG TPA: cupredoxin domain-containing protein [Burkholderiales bacterium]|jgi:cytochrome c oxidase subunit 2|nr:cupredoxin domain-containing protein [Burkholderiales bacterium]
MKSRNFVVWTINATLVVALMVSVSVIVLARSENADERIVAIKVKRFEYSPKEVTLKKGVPVVLQLSSLDVPHGFNLPDLNVRADVIPGKPAKLRIVPQQTGRFVFHCDIFCGTGHEELEGAIVVEE